MKKTLSIILSVLMIVCCIPIFVSAAPISLTNTNVEVIPPTVTPTEVKYGEGYANAVATGGQLWYVDESGNKTEVKGYFDIRGKETANPINTGPATLTLLFYPEDTETYGTVSGTLRHTVPIVSGEWPSIYIRGAYTEIVSPPTFSCDAGDNLASYPNYTKSGGRVVDAEGNVVTSSGQFYINEASTGGIYQYLYEDTYVTARWSGLNKSGYESSYYENVLVKVTKKTATLTAAPSIPEILAGTTVAEAMAKLTAKVSLKGTKTTTDSAATYWVPVYPEGWTADTPLTEDTTLTVKYENPATDDTFTADVDINIYTKPLAVIDEVPVFNTNGIKPGMKASVLTFTGGKAVEENSDTEVAGTFSIKNPDTVLLAGNNSITVSFIPDDVKSYDGTDKKVNVYITPLITALPVLDVTELFAGAKASDIKITGGVATEEGTFSVADPEQILTAGTNRITVVFTPAAEDAEYYETAVMSVTLKNKILFLDEEGNETVPEVTTLHDAVFGDTLSIGYSLNRFTNSNRNSYEYFDSEGNSLMGTLVPLGRNEITVKVTSADTNFVPNTLKFILVVAPKEFTVSPYYAFTSNKIKVMIDNKLDVPGEFDIYIDNEFIGTTENKEVKWERDYSCTVDIELDYKDDSGRYVLTNPTQQMKISFPRYIEFSSSSLPASAKLEGESGIAWNFNMGDRVVLKCDDPAFYGWSINYGEESYLPEGLTVEDLKNPTLIIVMPDHDLYVSAETKDTFVEEIECDHICHSENPLLQFIWKILDFLFRLFNIQQYCDCGITHYDAALFG